MLAPRNSQAARVSARRVGRRQVLKNKPIDRGLVTLSVALEEVTSGRPGGTLLGAVELCGRRGRVSETFKLSNCGVRRRTSFR